jgi:hypothetical protein
MKPAAEISNHPRRTRLTPVLLLRSELFGRLVFGGVSFPDAQ